MKSGLCVVGASGIDALTSVAWDDGAGKEEEEHIDEDRERLLGKGLTEEEEMQEIEEERGRFLSLLGNAVDDMVHWLWLLFGLALVITLGSLHPSRTIACNLRPCTRGGAFQQ